MPSPPLLEFEELLGPISGDEPAGTPTPFTLRQELDDARKEENPDDYAPDDPARPQQAKTADWAGIIRKTQAALKNTSKDLMLAARLTEALTRQHGFAGLRDGLHLFNLMLDQCWDRMHPSIEDGDLEVRASAFNWLDDPDRGARFPYTVRQVPVVFGEGGYSQFDWRQSMEGKGSVGRDVLEKAIDATSRDTVQTIADDLKEAQQELETLTEKLNGLLGQYAPGFTSLRPALGECATFVQQILQKKGGGVVEEEAPAEEQPAAGAGPAGEQAPARPKVPTRESLYRQLMEIGEQLQKIEPHSPIPYLIQRAVELGAMPFPQLMKALIRDENVLVEMNRELGIKEAPPPE